MGKPRIRLRSLMLLVAEFAAVFAVVPACWYLLPSFRTNTGGGGKELRLTVRVIDDATGKPIVGARVVVHHAFRPDLSPPRPDLPGRTDGPP